MLLEDLARLFSIAKAQGNTEVIQKIGETLIQLIKANMKV